MINKKIKKNSQLKKRIKVNTTKHHLAIALQNADTINEWIVLSIHMHIDSSTIYMRVVVSQRNENWEEEEEESKKKVQNYEMYA